MFGKKTTEHPTMEGRERLLQNRVLVPNWLFFDDASLGYDDWMKKYTNVVRIYFYFFANHFVQDPRLKNPHYHHSVSFSLSLSFCE
jgi:hypothetical protein